MKLPSPSRAVTLLALLLFLAANTGLLPAADSVIVFNEVHYHPADEDNDTEWVELHSLMGVDVDISDWELEGGINYRFANGTVIPGHGYLLVAADPSHPSLAGGDARGPFTGRLANNGESIRLVKNNDRTMDELNYGDDGDWPVGADGLGSTLSKRNEHTAESRPFNWLASPETGGTPGLPNFPGDSQGEITHDIVFSEIAAGDDPGFQVELTNVGSDGITLDG
ncbi:MAG: lamin tail domain-containing protein, partial [Verrucomicrobiota bacterium]|nr:lamin tail domain-containing protein [Verrucomicrobiota bacterium]